MLNDLISHVDVLLVVVITLLLYKLLGSPLHGITQAS